MRLCLTNCRHALATYSSRQSLTVKRIGVKKINFPSWLWASDVKQEEGIPTGEQLTQGMKDLGVDRGRVAQAVKIFLPAFKANNYKSLQNISTTDIASNPAKLKWFQGDVIPTRFKNNLVLPYLVGFSSSLRTPFDASDINVFVASE